MADGGSNSAKLTSEKAGRKERGAERHRERDRRDRENTENDQNLLKPQTPPIVTHLFQ